MLLSTSSTCELRCPLIFNFVFATHVLMDLAPSSVSLSSFFFSLVIIRTHFAIYKKKKITSSLSVVNSGKNINHII